MAATFRHEILGLDGTYAVRFYTGTGAPSDSPRDPCLAVVEGDEFYRWNGTNWKQLLSAASTVAVAAHGAITPAGVSDTPSATGTAADPAHTHAAGAFTGSAATTGSVQHIAGTGMTAAGQVMTSTDNQTVALNELAGMFLVTATANSVLYIVSNAAAATAPVAITVLGTPVTDAGAYYVLRSPAPAGTIAATGAPSATVAIPTSTHTHGVSAVTVTPPAHVVTVTP